MLTDPVDLLQRHCMLLERIFTELGKGPTVHKQCWVALMESEIEAKAYVQSGRPLYGNLDAPYR